MQIILLEKITNVGNLGDVVKVKDGYARNFLIPHGKAKRATPDNIKMLEAKRAELEAAANAKLNEAQAQGEKLEGLMVQITQKAGVDGRLFGSVTNADIAEALKGQGFTVEKAAVRMPTGPLKQIGDYPLVVALHADVTANITVSVLGDTSSGV
jgi:large subunit ribosomal protein L9